MRDRNIMNKHDNQQLHKFYTSSAWIKLRAKVLARDRYECQICKENGKYSKATTVHHVNHVREHIEMALQDTYTDENGMIKRNLISVCKDCHETVCHPERLRHNKHVGYANTERWD